MAHSLRLAHFAIKPIPHNGVVTPLADGDIIVIERNGSIDPQFVSISLQTAPGMWFKGIEAHGGGAVTKIEAEKGALTGDMTIAAGRLHATTLLFVKAKVFGVHTGMYELPAEELRPFLGRQITFDWQKD
ncbi:hypothetical protein [Sorangium sp. So ce131]|uniref:hypothetical protein n=1 Tax=Sorangium sp. So ce131 TaxID=3133282 RepID=UPI003F5E1E0B